MKPIKTDEGQLRPRRVNEIVPRLAAAQKLLHAHEVSLQHRDVTPGDSYWPGENEDVRSAEASIVAVGQLVNGPVDPRVGLLVHVDAVKVSWPRRRCV